MFRRVSASGLAAGFVLIVGVLGVAAWWAYDRRPSHRLRQAQLAARNGDYESADYFAQLFDRSGHPDHAALVRGEVLFRQGQHRLALGWLRRVRSDDSALYLQAAILNAQVLISQKQPRQATEVLAYVLSVAPEHVDAHRWLATIYYDQGDLSRAIPHLKEVTRLDPLDFRPQHLLALIFKDLDMEDEAIPHYLEALQRRPPEHSRDQIRIELADCQMKQFRYSDALNTLGELSSPDAVMFRVDALTATGKPVEADRALADALKTYPDHGGLLRLDGERKRAEGDHARAAAILERVVALDPYDHRSRYSLALAYEGAKQSAKAAEQHQRHQELKKLVQTVAERSRDATTDPWNESLRWELADLCEKLGRPQLAEMWRNAARACRTSDR